MRLHSNPLNLHPEDRVLERRKLAHQIMQHGQWQTTHLWFPMADGSFDEDHAHRVQAQFKGWGYATRLAFQESL